MRLHRVATLTMMASVASLFGLLALAFATADNPSAETASGTLQPGPMFGGTVHRNMANPVDKNIPSEWSVQEGKQKNIKWVAKLGTKAYGGPVVADGKVYAATDNRVAHDAKITGDKGILLCF